MAKFVAFGSSLARHKPGRSSAECFASAAAVFVHCQANQNPEVSQTKAKISDVSELRQENMLQSAADRNTDAVNLLLSQTVQALLQAEEKCRQTVKHLIGLLEHHLTVLDKKEEEEEVWDVIIQGRHRVEVCQRKIQELQLQFTFVQKLTDAAVEVACLAGSDASGQSLEEQLSSAQEQLDTARQHSLQVEHRLQEVQARCIQVIVEHAEKEEKKRKEREGG